MASKKTAKTGNPVEATETKSTQEFTVNNPQELRPKELPLVINPTSGGWKNDEQAEYAATLNAYAYKNPEKWEAKKDILLEQLTEIGNNPKAIVKYRGNEGRISYSNELYKNVLGE